MIDDHNLTSAPDPAAPPPPPKTHDRRAETSKINGAKSRGPKTADGKRKSAANSTRHGFAARSHVLACEDEKPYRQLMDEYIELWKPTNCQERDLVQDIIDAVWGIRRIKRHEQKMMNLEIARALPEAREEFERFDRGTLEALAFQNLTVSRDHENLDRYARRYERTYHKSIDMLLKLRGLRSFTDPVRNPTPPPPPPASEPAPQPDEPISPEPAPAGTGTMAQAGARFSPMRVLYGRLLPLLLALLAFLRPLPAQRCVQASRTLAANAAGCSTSSSTCFPLSRTGTQQPLVHRTLRGGVPPHRAAIRRSGRALRTPPSARG